MANRLSLQFVQSSHELMLEHNLDLKYDVVIGSIADSDVSQLVEYIEMGSTDINKLSVYELFTDDGRTLGEQMSLHTHKSLKCDILNLIRRYNLSESSARKAVQESFLFEALQNEPVETMHDSVNSSADDVYDEIFRNS